MTTTRAAAAAVANANDADDVEDDARWFSR